MTAKKPADRRQRRATKDLGVLPQIQVDPKAYPAAPAYLSDRWKAEWLTFWKSPFGQLVQPAQIPTLERLFSMRDERDRMDTELRINPMMIGHKGQAILNPLYRQRSAMDVEIRQLEDRFGLHPKAGLTIGIVYGEAARSLEELNARIANADAAEAEIEEDPRYIGNEEAEPEEAAVRIAE